MKKLLILFLLSISLSAFADSHLDFYLSDFCYQQPNVQERFEDGFLPIYPSFGEDYEHFWSQGTYYFPNEELGITDTSICVYKNAYGQYESKGELKNGKKNGTWTYWYVDGKKWFEFNFKNGKREGKSIHWDIYGNKSNEMNFKDDFHDGKFMSWWLNGAKMFVHSFKNGRRDGMQTHWYKNGQKKTEFSWKNGKIDGVSTLWNEKGEITSERTYKNHICISGDCPD